MNKKQVLLKQINESSFAIDDILLFLDTHPNDCNAMQYYREMAAVRRPAKFWLLRLLSAVSGRHL